MKSKILNSTVIYLKKYNKGLSNDDLERINYGLEGLYLTLTKMIIIFVLALILGVFKEVFTLLILFNFIRYTGFGFHANTSLECLVLSTLNFIVIPLIFLNVNLTNDIKLIICILCIFSYLLFAPADTVKRPLPNKKKRLIRKIVTVCIGIVYSILVFILPEFAPLLLSALVIQAIVIQPLLYKIFGQPYNNYKNYN